MRTVAHQMSLVTAAKGLREDAKEAARNVTQGSPDWGFYYGVQTAANEVLHAELSAARADAETWLGAESPSFREGYAKAKAALAVAAGALNPPLRIALPRP